MKARRGDWSRASIQRDRDRFELMHGLLEPECPTHCDHGKRIGFESCAQCRAECGGDWEGHEPNTYGGE